MGELEKRWFIHHGSMMKFKEDTDLVELKQIRKLLKEAKLEFPDLSKMKAEDNREHFGNLILYASNVYDWKKRWFGE